MGSAFGVSNLRMRLLRLTLVAGFLGCAGSSTETPSPGSPAQSEQAPIPVPHERPTEGPLAALLRGEQAPQLAGISKGDTITATEGCQASQPSAPVVLQTS